MSFDVSAIGLPTGSPSDTSITVANNANRMLLVFIAGGLDTTVQSITSITATKGGVDTAMTLIADTGTGNDHARVFAYRLLQPDTGTVHVKVTFGGNWPDAQRVGVGILSLYNVDQTTPIRGSVTQNADGGTPSEAISSATGDEVYDCVLISQVSGATLTPNGTQTSRIASTTVPDGDYKVAASSKAGAASVTMAWTSSASDFGTAQLIVSVEPVAAASGPTDHRMPTPQMMTLLSM